MGQSNYREMNTWQRRWNAVVEFGKRGFDLRYLSYRLKFRLAPKFDIVTRFPTHLDIELSDACNLRCVMCIQGIEDGVKGAGNMDTEFAKKMIDQGAQHGLRSIKVNWRGESALHRDLVEVIRHAKTRGILDVQMNTNGIPYTAERIRDIILSGLDRVIISIDGATKETYERIRVRASYEKLRENVILFWRIRNELDRVKPFIRIQMVRMRDNAHEVQEFIEMWKPYVDDIRISDVSNRGQGDVSVGEQVPVARARCPQPWQRMIVSRDGRVLPCCSDWYMQWVIGDAKKQDLMEIWHGKKMTKLRQLLRERKLDEFPPCNKCFVKESYIWERVTPRTLVQIERGEKKVYSY
jgi:radical SAM protein with 4Fe4S-binding SPASM domain